MNSPFSHYALGLTGTGTGAGFAALGSGPLNQCSFSATEESRRSFGAGVPGTVQENTGKPLPLLREYLLANVQTAALDKS